MHLKTKIRKSIGGFIKKLFTTGSCDSSRAEPPVSQNANTILTLHGFKVEVNHGNTYQQIASSLRYFNAPFVEMVYQASQKLGRRVRIADVGAACGDSVLLLEQRCSQFVEKYFCFEGDVEFSSLLRKNMKQFDKVVIFESLLASEHKKIRSLVKHHLGTASSTGEAFHEANPLDTFIEKIDGTLDILKIDVDGYDGEVLLGAKRILSTHKPWVIFEWHPELIQKAHQNCHIAFRALEDCGYIRLLWFNNIGTFSHFSNLPSAEEIDLFNEYLLKINSRCDEHFDIIALPFADQTVELNLAVNDYARWAAIHFNV